MSRYLCILTGTVIALVASAGERTPSDEFQPRTVVFSAAQLPLKDALQELQQKSGNVIKDARSNPTNPLVNLPRDKTTFWQSLDAIGKDTGIAFSAYQPHGNVALIDRAYREVKTSNSGAFRVAFKSILAKRDEDTGVHLCHTGFDVAWEPRIHLLYLNLDKAKVTVGGVKGPARSEEVPAQSVVNVARVSATEIDLRFGAPPRAVQNIASITGSLRAVGAPRMLEFKFTKPKGKISQTQDGVTVNATIGAQTDQRWSIAIEVEHPPEALLKEQSFQGPDVRSFRYYRVWLSWNKNRIQLEPAPGREQSKGAGIEYHFTSERGVALPPPDADVTLHFQTPNRLVAFTIPFSFQNLPLP